MSVLKDWTREQNETHGGDQILNYWTSDWDFCGTEIELDLTVDGSEAFAELKSALPADDERLQSAFNTGPTNDRKLFMVKTFNGSEKAESISR